MGRRKTGEKSYTKAQKVKSAPSPHADTAVRRPAAQLTKRIALLAIHDVSTRDHYTVCTLEQVMSQRGNHSALVCERPRSWFGVSLVNGV